MLFLVYQYNICMKADSLQEEKMHENAEPGKGLFFLMFSRKEIKKIKTEWKLKQKLDILFWYLAEQKSKQ